MLDKLMRFLDADDRADRAVYVFSWVVLTIYCALGIASSRTMQSLPDWRESAALGGAVLCIVVGIVVWKILRMERLSRVKNAVIALQGLLLFPWLSAILGMFLGSFIILLLHLLFRWDPLVSTGLVIAVNLSLLAGCFFGGCFAGLKIKRLVLFWSLPTIAWLYFMATRGSGSLMYYAIEAYAEIAMNFVRAGMLGLAIYGSYLGRRYSSGKADDGIDSGADGENAIAVSEG